ncbi:MFS transporter [Microlunatus sp. GCM10028923]|uniref:MFS transporter n=1 Tax=Microlunatus sp. GCM10028923 TaxID=3273400 RepID=UPI00361109C9
MASQTAAPELERRTLRKVALRLLPFLGLLYFINYLDRTNIGFAKLTMSDDLDLTQTAFGLASGIFFIGYLLLEVPSNLALHRFGARRWIARIMITWGIIASALAFVPNEGVLYVLRFLLGVAEAGFFPGIILYLTFWFPRRERAKVVAWFMVAIPISTVLGAPISTAIMQTWHGLFGMAGWRVMFLMEGIPAIILAFVTWFYLTDRPQDAKWLADDERAWLAAEMDAEAAGTEQRFHFPLRRALTNGRVIGLAFVYFGIVYGLYALSFFLPTIISGFQKQFGVTYSLVQVGLITAVPYALGAIAMIIWARHGDRTNERAWHVAIPAIVGGLAIPVALYLQSPALVMVAVSVCAVGVCCALPTFWALPTSFLTGAAAAGGIALVNSIGNLAGFAAPYITGFLADLTGTQNAGMWAVGAAMVGAGVLTLILGSLPKSRRSDGP